VRQFKQKNFLAIQHRESVDRARSELSLYCDEVHDATSRNEHDATATDTSATDAPLGVPSLLIAGKANTASNDDDNNESNATPTPTPSLSSVSSSTKSTSAVSDTKDSKANVPATTSDSSDATASAATADDDSSNVNRIIKRLATDVQRICAQHEVLTIIAHHN
jgi:hypothetical protein